MRQIMGAFAGYEKTMIILKLRGARARQRAKGERCEGRKPFGLLCSRSGPRQELPARTSDPPNSV